jgi:ABC-type uncharacterized transport system permease subunit
MIRHLLLSLLPLMLYAGAAIRLRGRTESAAARPTAAWLLAATGTVLHGCILALAIQSPRGLMISMTDSLSLIGWVIAATTVVMMAWRPLGLLAIALLLMAGVLALGTGLPTGVAEATSPAWEMRAHIALAALASGWLFMSAVIVLLLAWQQSRLRARRPLGLLAQLPPVETMENTLFHIIAAGFAVLTLALLTGFFFVYDLLAQHLVHKMVLAVLAWLVFGSLLIGRVRYGWRGSRALQFTLVGFASLVLAYFGSRFVLESLLGRHWG